MDEISPVNGRHEESAKTAEAATHSSATGDSANAEPDGKDLSGFHFSKGAYFIGKAVWGKVPRISLPSLLKIYAQARAQKISVLIYYMFGIQSHSAGMLPMGYLQDWDQATMLAGLH